MYCPRCATQNIDSARYCRACGANLSLVPQALTGTLPSTPRERIEDAIKRRREPNLGRGIRKSFIGFAFLMIVVGVFLTRSSPGMGGLWLLIPAFLLLGKGIGEIVTVITAESARSRLSMPPSANPTNALPPQTLYEPFAPPSVTEGTTRNLEDSSQRKRETT